MRCAIWYHLCNLNNVKNTHGGVLILVKVAGRISNSERLLKERYGTKRMGENCKKNLDFVISLEKVQKQLCLQMS